MAALDFTTAKSDVISALQASRTPYASTVDGSNAQFSSDTEIANAILYADAEICNAIINTPESPYLTTFIQTSGALTSGAPLPARNGIILKVQCLNTLGNVDWASTNVSTVTNLITIANASLILTTGLKVQVSTGGSLPSGLAVSTDYYIVVLGGKYGFATSLLNAYAGTLIVLGTAGTGTSTINAQYVDGLQAKTKDQVLGVNSNPQLYGSSWPNICKWWFIENDEVVTSSPTCKIVYSDYTLTSSPQAPQPLLAPVVAGAIGHLVKDGSDEQMSSYYLNIFEQSKATIRSGGMVVPAITSYIGNNNGGASINEQQSM